MASSAAPVQCEGIQVHLHQGYAGLRNVQRAGRQSGEEDADIMLFAASRGIVAADLFAGFFREEAADMDWLEDFLRDPDMEQMIVELQKPEEEEDIEEVHYDRRALTVAPTDMMDPN